MRKTIGTISLFFMGIGISIIPAAGTPASTHSYGFSCSQKQIKVPLQKDSRKNGYKLTTLNGEIFFEPVKVTDPETKKLIEGNHRLIYRCSENGPEIPVTLTFSGGKSPRTKITCLIIYEPIILLLGEPVSQ